MPTNPPGSTEVIEEHRPAITVQTVWAIWLGNFGSGLGVGVIVAILVNRVFNFTWADTVIWSLCAAGLVFGVLMAVRFSLDEIVEGWEWRRALADIERLEAENAVLRSRLEALQRDYEHAQLQLRARANLPAGNRVDVLPKATTDGPVRDAMTLLDYHYAGKPWARDHMRTYANWGRTRWEAALDVLKAAGIVSVKARTTIVIPATLTDALQQLRHIDS